MKRSIVLPDVEEFEMAAERMGHSNNGHMAWLLKFAQTDLDTLSAGDWLNLQHEVALFLWVGCPLLDPEEALQELEPDLPALPSKNEVVEIRKVALEHLKELITNRATRFTPQSVSLVVRNLGPVGKRIKEYEYKRMGKRFHTSDACYLTYEAKTPLAAFEYGLARLLAETGAYLRQCEECQNMFLADRRNKVFCSKTCLSRVTTRRQREIKSRHRHENTKTRRGGNNGEKRR